jgi:proteic killer suppression protein
VIKSFADKHTREVFERGKSRRFASILDVAERKLAMLTSAKLLTDLKSPPGNKLEALKKDRMGQHSIRINDQWRICFVWTEDGPENVEIVAYR